MTKIMERILQLDEVRKDDVIIFKYAGKIQRYIISMIDHFAIRAVTEDRSSSIRIFPVTNLIRDNWYVEREQGTYYGKRLGE